MIGYASFLSQYDAIPDDRPAERFGLLYGTVRARWRALLAELRSDWQLPLVTRWSDVVHALVRHEALTVATYRRRPHAEQSEIVITENVIANLSF